MKERIYLAIDLKSFYASVECAERGLDPLNTHLVVADASRTEKTICLAVSPSMKTYGIPGRARLFEVIQTMKQINARRIHQAPNKIFRGSSFVLSQLQRDPSLQADYIIAPPRMALYMQYSTRIYQIYLRYVAPEDIHVYSVDEVFMDITPYLTAYQSTPRELAQRIIQDVLHTTGITATAGIGSNLFLCKVAMDIVAKHLPADENGVRIAELDEGSYRTLLWAHRPLTDFWRVGPGSARKLETMGLYTMGDIARFSLCNENALYKKFGIHAELLIDHAWGYEPCTIADIKSYRPSSESLSNGQVLEHPCDYTATRLIVWEMADMLSMRLVSKKVVSDQLVLTIGYDIENLTRKEIREKYQGEITKDFYGRQIPRHAHGTISLHKHTASSSRITGAAMELFERIINPQLLVRRINISANHILHEDVLPQQDTYEQLDFFTDPSQKEAEERSLEREKSLQMTMLSIKHRFGKNAILKARNYQEGATARVRNERIGGHKA